MITWQEKKLEALNLLEKVKVVAENPEATGEERTAMQAMLVDIQQLNDEAATLKKIQILGEELGEAEQYKARTSQPQHKFDKFGNFLVSVFKAGSSRHRFEFDERLGEYWADGGPQGAPTKVAGPGPGAAGGWAEGKEGKASMAEGTGATGGFLVPTEFRAELLGKDYELNVVRQRATIIPMRRRQLNIPVLDQTGTTAGQPHQFGGILSVWTPEAAEKDQNDPAFRQIQLTAHKLVCYTRSSDEMLEDSAISLEALLRGPMGFTGAINWNEDYAFLRGTGAGQPLGVINAGATISVPRVAANTIGVADIMTMLMRFQGSNPLWHITRSAMATLLQLNGPAANPGYIFIPNGRDGMPATLMGHPIEWTEKLPSMGTAGDILLSDWSYYLIGDRQQTTIASTNIERFRYDQTSWRAVHRVDGQPWLSAPWTLADGTAQISPFVILGDKTT